MDERQASELEALRAIFMDDFEELDPEIPPTTPWKVTWQTASNTALRRFQLRLFPLESSQSNQLTRSDSDLVYVTLAFKLPRKYPASEVPLLTVVKASGLETEEVQRLQAELETKARELLGNEMVFDLATHAREFLTEITGDRKSKKLQRTELERVQKDQESLEREQKQRLERERSLEVKRSLQERIQQELDKKRSVLKQRETSRARPTSSSSASAKILFRSTPYSSVYLLQSASILPAGHNARDMPLRAVEQFPLQPAKSNQHWNHLRDGINFISNQLFPIRHPNIPHISGIELRSEIPAIEVTREFLPGAVSTAQLLQQAGPPLSLPTIRKCITATAKALSVLHDRGLFHGCLSLESILLCEDRVLLVNGYYLERIVTNAHSFLANAHGFPHIDSEPSIAADLESVGEVLVQMVLGRSATLQDLRAQKDKDLPLGLVSLVEALSDRSRPFSTHDILLSDFMRTTVHDAPLHKWMKEISIRPKYSRPTTAVTFPPAGILESTDSRLTLATNTESQPVLYSRYRADFTEIEVLGKGGFGEVVKVQNRLDGRYYAIKKLALDSRDQEENRKILREVLTLARLHHQYVVRYYQAWMENVEGGGSFVDSLTDHELADEPLSDHDSDTDGEGASVVRFGSGDWLSFGGKKSPMSDSHLHFEKTASAQEVSFGSDDQPSTEEASTTDDALSIFPNTTRTPLPPRSIRILYIQMEFCEKLTLKNVIDGGLDIKESWHLFRQIVEGLVHIHGQGVIHRDLKPTNIFLDANGDVKIGDFGLATRMDNPQMDVVPISPDSDSLHDLDEDSSMTAAIGTSFYIAPELLTPSRGKYNQKVDIYSLGIIFFECLYRFNTQMERAHALQHLRKIDIQFPLDFDDKKTYTNQAHILRWLLDHQPRNRPTSLELLQSEFLPAKMEDEFVNEALRTIANPRTPYYSRLMTALFSQSSDRHADFTFDFNSGNSKFTELGSVMMSRTKDALTQVFARHGAVELSTPLLMPRSSMNESKMSVVRLMDSDGGLVELPHDLTVPFARWIARNPTTANVKRWCFDQVYRQNIVGGQPRVVHEADFDIVHASPGSIATYDAEVIKVVVEILEEFPVTRSKGYHIRLSHGHLLRAILDDADVALPHRSGICDLVNQLDNKYTWKQLRTQFQRQFHLTTKSLDILESFFLIRGNLLAGARRRCEGLLNKYSFALDGWKQLEDLARRLEEFGVH